ncbi:MAG: cell division protein ZapA [Deltaproteobacteria bacterium]|nr:cell division protein ZapA [Deltaproteobacteria bacterium]
MTVDPDRARQALTLEIGGQRLRLRAHGSDEQLLALAAQVNDRYLVLQSNAKTAPPATLLAMVALDLADELASTRDQLTSVQIQSREELERAHAHSRAVEDSARRLVAQAIEEIDRSLQMDDATDALASDVG